MVSGFLTNWATTVVARLRLAFVVIAAVILAGILVVGSQLSRLRTSQDLLVQRAIPSLLSDQALSRELTALLGLTAQLSVDLPKADLMALRRSYDQRKADLSAAIRGFTDPRALNGFLSTFLDGINQLNQTSDGMFQAQFTIKWVEEELAGLKKELTGLHEAFKGQSELLLLDASAALQGVEPARPGGTAPLATQPEDLNSLLTLEYELNQITSLAGRAASTTDKAALPAIQSRLEFQIRSSTQVLLKLRNANVRRDFAVLIDRIRTLINGKSGIIANQDLYQSARRRLDEMRSMQVETVAELTKGLDDALATTRIEIETATELFRVTMKSTAKTVGGIAGLIFICIVLVNHLVVERQINRRISRLSDVVRAMAGGDMSQEVDTTGKDEIAGIAGALAVFKKNSEELSRSNAELQKFAYVASHDLRAPLNAIHDLAQWTLEDAGDVLPEECRSNLELLMGRVDRLSTLLRDLLEYAQAGREEQRISKISIRNVVENMTHMIDLEKKFEIKVIDDVGVICTYSTPMQQILLNLIVNSVKHHDRDRGIIEIRSWRVDDRILVSIFDDGPGIEPSYHDKVFGLFQTLKSRDDVEGSGMGLAIITKLLDRYGGQIDVSSDPSKKRGTKFTFDFPCINHVTDHDKAA